MSNVLPESAGTPHSAQTGGSRGAKWLWALALIILAYGIALRTWRISDIGYFTDELFHAISAEHIATVGHQAWPTGGEYLRAMPYTQAVATSFRWFGVDEATARLPSIVANLLLVLLSFLYVRNRFGMVSGLIYLLLICCAPMELVYARQCRMYAPFQLFYFLASIAFWHGFEAVSLRGGGALQSEAARAKTILFFPLLLSGLLLAAALILHDLSVTLLGVVGIYIAARFVQIAWSQGMRKALSSKAGIVLAVGLFAVGLICLLQWNLVLKYVEKAFWVPGWAVGTEYGVTYFARRYFGQLPLLCVLFPIVLIYQLRKHGTFGLFLVISFTVPFAFHSLVFPMKQDRYVYHLFPFFAMILAPFVAQLLRWSWSSVRQWLNQRGFARAGLAASAALVVCAGLLAYPWMKFPTTRELAPWEDWKTFYLQTGPTLEPSARILTTNPLAFYHYFSRVADFHIRAEYDPTSFQYLTEAPQVRTLHELKAATESALPTYVIVPRHRYTGHVFLTDEMRAYIEREYEEITLPYRSQIRLFRALQRERPSPGTSRLERSLLEIPEPESRDTQDSY